MPTEEELLKRKLLEQRMMEQQLSTQQQAMQQAQAEQIIKRVMAEVLEPAARERLSNVKMVKPELAAQLELYLVQLYQSGQLRGRKLTDEQIKEILLKLTAKPEWKIQRK
jgi:programmed cell death protein 5